MSCLNNHPDDQIQEREGKRVCLACKRQYAQRNNTRVQKAINAAQRAKGKENRKAARARQHNHKNANTRVQNRQSAVTSINVESLPKEKNNERDDNQR